MIKLCLEFVYIINIKSIIFPASKMKDKKDKKDKQTKIQYIKYKNPLNAIMIKNYNSQPVIEKLRQDICLNALPNFIEINQECIRLHTIKRILAKNINQISQKDLLKKFFYFANQIYDEEEQITHLEKLIKKTQNNPQYNNQMFKLIIKQYTKQNFFHKLLNNSMRFLQDITQLQYFQFFISTLHNGIKQKYRQSRVPRKKQPQQKISPYQMYPFTFTCYRGGWLSQKEISFLNQNVNKCIQLLGFMSTSQYQEVAKRFITNVLIEIQVFRQARDKTTDYGYYMIQKSAHEEEREILFNVLNTFKVQSFVLQGNYYKLKLIYGRGAKLLKNRNKINILEYSNQKQFQYQNQLVKKLIKQKKQASKYSTQLDLIVSGKYINIDKNDIMKFLNMIVKNFGNQKMNNVENVKYMQSVIKLLQQYYNYNKIIQANNLIYFVIGKIHKRNKSYQRKKQNQPRKKNYKYQSQREHHCFCINSYLLIQSMRAVIPINDLQKFQNEKNVFQSLIEIYKNINIQLFNLSLSIRLYNQSYIWMTQYYQKLNQMFIKYPNLEAQYFILKQKINKIEQKLLVQQTYLSKKQRWAIFKKDNHDNYTNLHINNPLFQKLQSQQFLNKYSEQQKQLIRQNLVFFRFKSFNAKSFRNAMKKLKPYFSQDDQFVLLMHLRKMNRMFLHRSYQNVIYVHYDLLQAKEKGQKDYLPQYIENNMKFLYDLATKILKKRQNKFKNKRSQDSQQDQSLSQSQMREYLQEANEMYQKKHIQSSSISQQSSSQDEQYQQQSYQPQPQLPKKNFQPKSNTKITKTHIQTKPQLYQQLLCRENKKNMSPHNKKNKTKKQIDRQRKQQCLPFDHHNKKDKHKNKYIGKDQDKSIKRQKGMIKNLAIKNFSKMSQESSQEQNNEKMPIFYEYKDYPEKEQGNYMVQQQPKYKAKFQQFLSEEAKKKLKILAKPSNQLNLNDLEPQSNQNQSKKTKTKTNTNKNKNKQNIKNPIDQKIQNLRSINKELKELLIKKKNSKYFKKKLKNMVSTAEDAIKIDNIQRFIGCSVGNAEQILLLCVDIVENSVYAYQYLNQLQEAQILIDNFSQSYTKQLQNKKLLQDRLSQMRVYICQKIGCKGSNEQDLSQSQGQSQTQKGKQKSSVPDRRNIDLSKATETDPGAKSKDIEYTTKF